MKKFLVRLLIFGCAFFLIDKAFILVRDRVPSLEADQRLEQLINGQINAEVYIMGSSRGARNVIPLQIEKSIEKSVYNISYPGSNIDFHEYLLQEMLLANKKPDQIILVIDDEFELISNESNINFRYDRLYPLVAYPSIRKTLVERGEKNAVLSKLFVLHQLNRSNFTTKPKPFSKNDSIFENGSMTISFTSPKFDKYYNDQISVNKYDVKNESPFLREKFISFIKTCLEKEIDLVISFPPNYRLNNVAFEKRIEEIAGDQVGYMHFDKSNPEYRNPENYSDVSHLQKKGAVIFTDDLIAYLKRRSQNE